MLKGLKRAKKEIKENQAQLNRYREYYLTTQWSNTNDFTDRKEVESAVYIMLNSQVKTLERVLGMIEEDDYGSSDIKEFIETVVKLVDDYIDDSKRYINAMEWSASPDRLPLEIESPHKEMQFQVSLIKKRNDLEENISKLNLLGETESVIVKTYSGQIIPICVYEMIEHFYPNIKDYIKTRKKRKE